MSPPTPTTRTPRRTPRRTRADRCPGALRPWPADDGLLVRLRLIGGRVSPAALLALCALAEEYADGHVHLTARANLQIRGLPAATGASTMDDSDGVDSADSADGADRALLRPDVLAGIEATGLLPARRHELVRNVMVSPQTGLAGGRADLRPVAAELDRLICAREPLAGLPGRFLFVLDDGRGDLLDRSCDLGLVALAEDEVQLRVGDAWGPVLPLERAAAALADLATQFDDRRGSGPEAPWHVAELERPLAEPVPADPRIPSPRGRLPYGVVAGGRHVAVPAGLLERTATQGLVASLADPATDLIVTPWHGVLVPEETP